MSDIQIHFTPAVTLKFIMPFPHTRVSVLNKNTPNLLIKTPLQQTTFENIMSKGEIYHDEHFPLFPQFLHSFTENFHMFSKTSAANLLYEGKGSIRLKIRNRGSYFKDCFSMHLQPSVSTIPLNLSL